jgi:hypothetical protein
MGTQAASLLFAAACRETQRLVLALGEGKSIPQYRGRTSNHGGFPIWLQQHRHQMPSLSFTGRQDRFGSKASLNRFLL